MKTHMSSFYKSATKLIRALPAETAHNITIQALKAGLGPKHTSQTDPRLAIRVGGLDLPHPVGLAAGFDKNADVPHAMLSAGFGFVECGTVTPKPQSGNPKPRLFRLNQDRAVINRMGFNNKGLDNFANNLSQHKSRSGLIGANLGANKTSQDRIEDYVSGLRRLWGQCDYFTINISSPNTPGLRGLQSQDALDELLGRIAEIRSELSGDKPSVPIFLKVAPDLDFGDVGRMTEQARLYGMNAIIISNTTIERPDHLQSPHRQEAGGLSGAPLFERSTHMLKAFAAAANGKIDLIGVGGISSGAEAYAKIRAGAKAVQLYSALVYQGPGLVTDICDDLLARLSADGFHTLSEAVGRE